MVSKSRPAGAEQAGELLHMFDNADASDVRRFLDGHPYLLSVLAQAFPMIQRYFGPDAAVSLTVERDPEAGTHEELYAVIETGWPVEDALSRMAAFDDRWWLDTLPAARGKLSITVAGT